MSDFVHDAFAQAESEELKKEISAWKNISPDEMKKAMLAAIVAAGPIDMAKLILLVEKAGLADVTHTYENCLMMAGFSLGYAAGRESMMEDGK